MTIHPNSQEFSEVRRKCEAGIEAARNALERHSMTVAEAEFLRGRINAFREIVAMGEPSPIDRSQRFEMPARLGDRSGIM